MRITSGFLVLAMSVLCASRIDAQGRSNSSRGQGRASGVRDVRVQKAIDNRQQVLDRVLQRTQGTPRANAAASTRGNIPDVNALRRDALQRVGTQSGTGRINRDIARSRSRGFRTRSIGTGRRESLRRSAGLRRNGLASNRVDVPIGASEETATRRQNRRGRNVGRSNPRTRLAATKADRLLAQRLAAIDRLRDIGLRNGNVRQLEQADRLEQLARQQFERRTNGTKMNVPLIFRRQRSTTDETNRDTSVGNPQPEDASGVPRNSDTSSQTGIGTPDP